MNTVSFVSKENEIIEMVLGCIFIWSKELWGCGDWEHKASGHGQDRLASGHVA